MIAAGCLVALRLQILDPEGTILLDTKKGDGGPLLYLHGQRPRDPALELVLPVALEESLAGKAEGEVLDQVLPCPFGERVPGKAFRIPREEAPEDLAVGDEVEQEIEGHKIVAKVVGLESDVVLADANHPLAGLALRFVVTVEKVQHPAPPRR